MGEGEDAIGLARRWLQAVNRRDVGALDDLAHPGYSFENATGMPGGGVHRGRARAKAFAAEFFDLWERWEVEAADVLADGDHVLVVGVARGQGRASGLVLDTPIGYLHTVRDGRLAATRVFLDHDEAKRALQRG